jgi:hypothetical protein
MKATYVVGLLTVYLIIYSTLFLTGVSAIILSCMFLISPLLLIAGVYLVLRDDKLPYPELEDDDEFGYLDKSKDELGTF